jgi:hypothetical protein
MDEQNENAYAQMAMQQMSAPPPAVNIDECKMIFDQVKEEYESAKRNCEPVSRGWWIFRRPAHKRGFCPYQPVGTEVPLKIDPTTGQFAECSPEFRYLLDNLELARLRYLKYETMFQRIHRGELVPRSELQDNFELALTAEERVHIRKMGYIHIEELDNAIHRFLNSLQLKDK